jgi:uncharacterized protein (TIGR00369 family)
MSATHYRRLEAMYRRAPINELYAPTIAVAEGSANIEIPVRESFFHAAHALHGSVYFKMLDDACFFAVNSLVEDVLVLTVSFTTYITRPVREGRLRAEGRAVHSGGSLFLAEAIATTEDGAVVARGNGSFLRSKIALGPELGYLD